MSDREKLIATLRLIYTEEVVRIWLADAVKKGLSLGEQLNRAELLANVCLGYGFGLREGLRS